MNLVAVQARVDGEACRAADAFAERVDELTAAALRGLDRTHPSLVCFPEYFALPLVVELGRRGAPARSPVGRLLQLARAAWRPALAAAVRHRVAGPGALILARALEVHEAYERAFGGAARRHGVYVVGGSLPLPPIDREISRGTFVAAPRVHNTLGVFGPGGQEIGRASKTVLTETVERRVVSAAPVALEGPVETSFGTLGVLICLDAFFESRVRAMDNRGVEIVVQPSANDGWDEPWKFNRRQGTRLTEAEVWMQGGLARRIQDRERIRFGVNPMLVGDYLGLRFQGRSSIVANRALCGGDEVIARAAGGDQEIVAAQVSLPAAAGRE